MGYGGGDLEFYDEWGQKEPSEKHRLKPGCGVAFCGCQRNVHAVAGVRWGFRLVFLIWTRPLEAEVPDDQKHVCYFRPGTGLSVWLTTADLQEYPARRQQKRQTWVPVCPGRKETEEIKESKIGSSVEGSCLFSCREIPRVPQGSNFSWSRFGREVSTARSCAATRLNDEGAWGSRCPLSIPRE